MSRKRFTAKQIVGLLREADVKLSQGRQVGQTCRDMGITEQTYYRWLKEYGGMKTVQVKRLKDLERENGRLKRAVAELAVDRPILKDTHHNDSFLCKDSTKMFNCCVFSPCPFPGQRWLPCSIREKITVAYFTIRLFFMDMTPLTLLTISDALSTAF